MAGDWIKMECATPEKPEVFQMAEALDIAPEHVVGCLISLWIWADQQTIDGNASGVTKLLVDRKASVPGFAEAMKKVGWLVEFDDGLTFPNFDHHNGKTAKERALCAKRAAKHRAKSNDESNGNGVTDALPREEKRREENNPPKSPQGGRSSRGKSAITLKTYLEQCKAEGVPAIAEDHPVQAYAESIGLPQSFLRLAWLDFKCEFTERNPNKKYKSWSQHFNNWVQKNYHKLWWLDGEEYRLTTKGQQAAKQNNWRDE